MKTVKTILATDTAMGGCSACVYDTKAHTGVCMLEPMTHGQGERLLPLINETLASAGATYGDLGAILTTIGPGAFTGLRIGLSAARATAMALDIPLYGVSTLQALAASYETDRNFFVLVETRREDFYIQEFGANRLPLSKPDVQSAEKIWKYLKNKTAFFIGDGAARFKNLAPEAETDESLTLPDLKKTVKFCLENPETVTENPEPLYLRPADVSAPKTPARKLKA